MIQLVALIVAFLNLQTTFADVYMHNPRGSNDRNCERNVNRDNANRLFNSQNNNNGGYACQRGVGSGAFQAEDGTATFNAVDVTTGTTNTFTQNKRMYYYSGSVLPIEWTNQHGCGGNSKISCEIVLQYACEDTLDPRVDNFWPWVTNKAGNTSTYYGTQHFRSGANIAAPRDGVPRDSNDAATDTINDDEASAIPSTTETQRYGMQESYDYYQLCQYTERNKGLYTADQQVNRDDRRGTRQNPNGNRHGFECPEERDYYPWWAPSPWIDIAVLTDSANETVCYHYSKSCTKRCEYYMNNTMNWNKKGYCDVSHNGSQPLSLKYNSRMWQNRKWYNNKDACVNAGFHWFEVSHKENLNLANNSFVCAMTQFARVNQLGNAVSDSVVSQNAQAGVSASHVTEGVNANRFMWTIPQIPTSPKGSKYFSSMTNAYKSCVLRMRYNTSSADFQQWPADAVDAGTARMVDSKNNSRTRNDLRSPLHQDPYVTIGPGDDSTKAAQFVKLKVNTNQYGRTFQDRSYVFSIKPLPTTSSASSNAADTPAYDATAVKAAMAAGGKIYNVNVRGKRGNIVQVYPSVEYDFVPNALSLGVNDMVHFQWSGSDYNPRRGCNDATGGPPDTNDYQTDANANQNSRADRSNVVFTYHMGNNVPKDYLGYTTSMNLTWNEKWSIANETVLAHAPCYNNKTDSVATGQACYKQMMRLAYLNQQSDSGSLTLRGGKSCLTQAQLDAISNSDTADNHPLNCAKLNAKPYPYFDGGVMIMKKNGWFPYYSSRNNNFSNRQNIGVLCVGSTCKVDPATGVLQDQNPQTTGTSTVTTSAATTPSKCYDTASGSDGANANGAHSCLPTAAAVSQNITYIISTETFATQEQDNDALGDGNAQGCAVLQYSTSSSSTVESDLALAFILLAVGLFTSWLAYYLYNRYQARRAEESKFRYDTAWQKAEPVEKKARPASVPRPTSVQLTEINPGVKMARPKAASAPAKNYQKVKRTEMI
mmetsp:Transcript_10059/g.10870  ORF Transcript_10059/g.10870 Transcript_10059/m.10870 type:complete len:992 (-) Transcript_10059:478-3453(-)|eukprot:gene6283-6762_t